MLLLSSLSLAVLCSLSTPIRAQANVHNVTPIGGTWTSGSGAVMTGPGFVNPVNFTFHYPKNTGVSWSFTEDGHFEQAEYRMVSNGSQPNCIQGTVLWQHGTYEWLANGSIVATPIAIDGRLQVEDPCAAQSNVIMQFNTTVLMQSWRIFSDADRGPKLQMYQFDGSPYSPMFLAANPPQMMPTETLSVNMTFGPDGSIVSTNAARRTFEKGAAILLVTMFGMVLGGVMVFA